LRYPPFEQPGPIEVLQNIEVLQAQKIEGKVIVKVNKQF